MALRALRESGDPKTPARLLQQIVGVFKTKEVKDVRFLQKRWNSGKLR